ncbi:hypothetical protein [Staphylococcus phage PT94]
MRQLSCNCRYVFLLSIAIKNCSCSTINYLTNSVFYSSTIIYPSYKGKSL